MAYQTSHATLIVLAFTTPAIAQNCAEGQRLFDHAAGETCTPEDPQRIVTLQSDLEARIAEVRETLGSSLDNTTISFLTSHIEDGQFYPTNPTQAMGVILRGLEPIRPEAESELAEEREYRSIETIGAHEADVMFQLVFDADDRGDSDAFADFTSHPLVQATSVVQAGQIYPLDGSQTIGSAWGKVMNGLDQIAAVLTREDLNRDLVEE